MSRKKESHIPAARRTAMSGFSKPGTLARGEWSIDWVSSGGGTPSVSLAGRKATLWQPTAIGIEAHEGWHIAHTPHRSASEWADEIAEMTGAEVTVDDVRAVEDGRINRIGLAELAELSPTVYARVYAELGMHTDPADIKKHVTAMLKIGNQRAAARLLVAALPHSEPLLRFRAWRGDARKMVHALASTVRRAGLHISGVAIVCDHIARLPTRLPPPPRPPIPPPPVPLIHGGRPSTVYVPPPPPVTGDVQWGSMKIVSPRLTESVHDGTDAFTRPTSEPGTMPKFLHRWRPWEGSFDIFARKRRDQGPRVRLSLLIDGSGSMSWGDEDLAAVQERLPAATVAIYASNVSTYEGGTLCIIAAAGKRMVFNRRELSNKYDVGGGNVVDGPALRWLGRQSGPRLWMSDEAVTGIGDKQTPSLVRDAYGIVAACGIVTVRNSSALFQWLDSHGFRKSAVRRLR